MFSTSNTAVEWLTNSTEYNNHIHNSHVDDKKNPWNEMYSNSSNATGPPTIFLPCNNPDNLISQETSLKVEQLVQVTILPLLELFGIITNVINGLVFARQGLKDRINLCLFSLAVADIAFLILVFITRFHSFLGLVDKELDEYWRYRAMNTVLGPMLGALNISNLMTLIIAVERCVCVLSPFTAKRFLKTRYMAVLIVVMSVYVLGFYSLLNTKYVTLHVIHPVTNRTRWVARLSDFYLQNRVVIDVLYNHLLSLSIPCLSLAVVVVTTSVTFHRLRASLSWRSRTASKATAGEKREDAVTRMLTVVCFIYVSTMTLSVTQVFFRTFLPGYLPTGKLCNTFRLVQPLGQLCEVINSSVNFIVYFSMGSKFRSTVRQLFCTDSQFKPPVTESLTAIIPFTVMDIFRSAPGLPGLFPGLALQRLSQGAFVGPLLSLIFSVWLSMGMNFNKNIKKQPWLPPASTAMCWANESVPLFNTMAVPSANHIHPFLNTTPSSVDMSSYYGFTTLGNFSHQDDQIVRGLEVMYTLSYQWLATVGSFLSIFIGLLVSLITGGNREGVDPRYIVPFCDRFCGCLPRCVRKMFSCKNKYLAVKDQDGALYDLPLDNEVVIMKPTNKSSKTQSAQCRVE